MGQSAHELARQLADRAEAVCRHYLFNGSRKGLYWVVGDVRNSPGRSMYVRLKDSPSGMAGKWTDAATGEYGDLLDVIRETSRLVNLAQVADEARAFLHLPPRPSWPRRPEEERSAFGNYVAAARRLFVKARPAAGTMVEIYLARRGIVDLRDTGQLRFHPNCYYRSEKCSLAETWPAMIAAVTDLDGGITGVHRTWLDPRSNDKAPIDTPRRSMGNLLGNAVRFGTATTVMAAGEGIETVLSVRQILPGMPMVAALSAGHLAAIQFPDPLKRLYIIRDKDTSGDRACDQLVKRARAASVEAIVLSPRLGDFNEDLCRFGLSGLRAQIVGQADPHGVARFLVSAP
ncbi:DNA primase [Agrobacterium rhizogenes]|nr:DNA primase [Rhizobium rhizogenes]NTJ77806.1 DNA primase [Rhizobium rhizogenes]